MESYGCNVVNFEWIGLDLVGSPGDVRDTAPYSANIRCQSIDSFHTLSLLVVVSEINDSFQSRFCF